jgi:hypothetical protein
VSVAVLPRYVRSQVNFVAVEFDLNDATGLGEPDLHAHTAKSLFMPSVN